MPFRTVDQRRFPRRDSAAELTLSDRLHDLIDLSARGFGVSADRPLAVGDTLAFALRLPGAGRVEGKARVRWRQANGRWFVHGCEIVGMPPWHRYRLDRHLDPRRFGWLEFCDLLLEFCCAAALVLAAGSFLGISP